MKAATAACILLVLLAVVQPFDALRLMKDGTHTASGVSTDADIAPRLCHCRYGVTAG